MSEWHNRLKKFMGSGVHESDGYEPLHNTLRTKHSEKRLPLKEGGEVPGKGCALVIQVGMGKPKKLTKKQIEEQEAMDGEAGDMGGEYEKHLRREEKKEKCHSKRSKYDRGGSVDDSQDSSGASLVDEKKDARHFAAGGFNEALHQNEGGVSIDGLKGMRQAAQSGQANRPLINKLRSSVAGLRRQPSVENL